MQPNKSFDNYPFIIVFLSNLVTLLICLLGAIIISGLGLQLSFLFILYCFVLEVRLLKKSCVNCCYFGKLCFSGKGFICSLFFKKGDPKQFISTPITWIQLIPDFLVLFIPLFFGIVLSIVDFSWLRIGFMILLIILGFPVTGYIRGTLACPHCRQRENGCPAADLFAG